MIDHVGKTSIANSLSYFGGGYLFVGSVYGDSQLIKLLPDKVVVLPDWVSTSLKVVLPYREVLCLVLSCCRLKREAI